MGTDHLELERREREEECRSCALASLARGQRGDGVVDLVAQPERHAAAEELGIDEIHELRRARGDVAKWRDVDLGSDGARELGVRAPSALVDHLAHEVRAMEHRVGVVDAELRREKRRSRDAVVGRVIVEHRRRIEHVLSHRARRLVQAVAVGDRIEAAQDRHDVQHGLPQHPVARIGLDVAARLRVEEHGPQHGLHVAAHAVAVVVECGRHARDVRRRRIAGDQLADQVLRHERARVGMQEHVGDDHVDVALRRLSRGSHDALESFFDPVSWRVSLATIGRP